jgi:hypothetical protein
MSSDALTVTDNYGVGTSEVLLSRERGRQTARGCQNRGNERLFCRVEKLHCSG